jgi:hypothetical protein
MTKLRFGSLIIILSFRTLPKPHKGLVVDAGFRLLEVPGRFTIDTQFARPSPKSFKGSRPKLGVQTKLGRFPLPSIAE